MRRRRFVPTRSVPVVMVVAGLVAVGCGSNVKTHPDDSGAGAFRNAREVYDEVIDDAPDLPSCEHLSVPSEPGDPPWHHAEQWDDGCYVELEADDMTSWTTFCEGTSCVCLENGEPLCACETEVPWCDVPSSSCCPAPWPRRAAASGPRTPSAAPLPPGSCYEHGTCPPKPTSS